MEKSLSNSCAKKSRRLSMSWIRIALLPGLAAALMANGAQADEAADVSGLLRANRYAEAMVKADAFLARKPQDAQMRFLKGVILTEQNKTTKNIATFSKLTEDFPALPEPNKNHTEKNTTNKKKKKTHQTKNKTSR